MKKYFLPIAVLCIYELAYSQAQVKKVNWEFIVDDDSTAIKIAEAVWVPKIGGDVYNKKKPYKAILLDDSTWVVYGSVGTK